MPPLKILGLAVALAMDAFAVSLAVGFGLRRITLRHTFRLAWHFGLFQALMPILGWACAQSVRGMIERYDHWIAFALLAFVGGNMIRAAFSPEEDKHARRDPTRGVSLVLLSVATSVDALAAGLCLAVLEAPIVYPAAVIGVTALLCTAAGLHLGNRARGLSRLGSGAECAGGVLLLVIGGTVLYEHGVFHALAVPCVFP